MQSKPINKQNINTNKSRKLMALVIASIILFILFYQFISNSIFAGILYFYIGLIVIFLIIGFGVGKYFKKVSWKVIILPTIPWIIYWWALYAGSYSPNSPMLIGIGIIGLILYIFVLLSLSIGNRLRIWAEKGKNSQYVKYVVLSLITAIIFMAIIFTIENKTPPTISLEINTRPNISINEVYNGDIIPFEKQTKLQELKAHNSNFVSKINYRLPDVTACFHDIDDNRKLFVIIVYMTEDRQEVNEILVKPNTELKVNLQIYSMGEVQDKRLLNWRRIPEYENPDLLYFLKNDFDIDVAKNAKIEKINNDSTIIVSYEKKIILLSLNNEKTKVNLTIDDGRTYKLFVVRDPWNDLIIYKPIEKEKFDEILLFKNVGMNNFSYCHDATDEEILAAEKVKILK